jgi:hypothetical protein
LSLPAVTALVGAGPTARIRADHFEMDDADQAAILLEVDEDAEELDLQGTGGLGVATITVTCRDRSLARAQALAMAVKYNGSTPGSGLAGWSAAGLDLLIESTQQSRVPRGDSSETWWNDVILSGTAIYDSPGQTALTQGAFMKFATSIGDGASTTYTVIHKLATTDVEVQVFDATENLVECQVQVVDLNTVSIAFAAAPAVAAYRVVVLG